MARDWLYLGPVPANEDCEQVSSDGEYSISRMKAECRIYVAQLERMFPAESKLCTIRLKIENHDFGTYVEVVVEYDTDQPESGNAAIHIEHNTPSDWDDIARAAIAELHKEDA